jgi:hypothetical protein
LGFLFEKKDKEGGQMLVQEQSNPTQVLTKDIFSVSYFLAKGMTLKDILIDEDRPREKATFVLEGQGIDRLDRAIRTGTALVNLLDFKDSMKRAKDLMFDFLRSKESYEKNRGAKANDLHQKPDR